MSKHFIAPKDPALKGAHIPHNPRGKDREVKPPSKRKPKKTAAKKTTDRMPKHECAPGISGQ